MRYLIYSSVFLLTSHVDGYSVSSSVSSFHARSTRHSFGTSRPTSATTARKRPSSSSLYMHMGHSHSHHDHSHPSSSSHESSGPLIRLGRRQIALLAFAAIAILGPQLVLKQRSLTRAHVAVFFLTSLGLSMADAIRKSVLHMIVKLQKLRRRVLAHAPRPTVNANSSSRNGLYNYLFRNDNAADRVTLLGVAMNIVLSVGKLVIGVTCHSSALVADAGHSLSDLCSDFVTLGSVQLARLPPDEDHPYGHGKFEAIGSLFLALTLLVTGVGIGTMANAELMQVLKKTGLANVIYVHAHSHGHQAPTPLALVAALVSIVGKEWLYRVTLKVGESINSQVVIANAWHHRSDAYSSVLALFSIGLAMYVPGLAFCDAAAGLLVAGMICLTGADILGASISQLTDAAALDESLETRVHDLAETHGDVLSVTQIRARQVGPKAFMDVAVEIPPDFSSSAIRAVEDMVRLRVISEPFVADAVVRASSKKSASDVVVCPLLEATTHGHSLPTVSEVENSIRQVLLLKHHDVIVKGMTVHYGEGNMVHVDVNISFKGESDADAVPRRISDVQQVADQVRMTIEGCEDYIRQANIFLDLNQPNSVQRSALLV
ncbi:hypothetical protein MPSEU_000584700 [Mayamaea pseudoterrestris]|nr:hypothetical protein MPSEU_000584700 [Mayamaea pseudoterrestris]